MTLILDPDDPAGWREAPPAPAGAPSSTGSRLTDGLNPQQREAVEYRGQALLIVAGAGLRQDPRAHASHREPHREP